MISGSVDTSAPADQLVEVFKKYPGRVHILPGVGHQVTKEHAQIGASFLAEVLG